MASISSLNAFWERLPHFKREERQTALSEIKKSLREGEFFSNPITVDQFLLLHGDTFLDTCAFKGSTIDKNLPYWESFLSFWLSRDTSTLLIDPGLTSQEIQLLSTEYKSLREFENLIQNYWKTQSREAIKAVVIFINKALDQKGHCTISLGTIGKNRDPGHTFACVFTKNEKSELFCHLLNKGEGAELHPTVAIDGSKIKPSFRFPPIKLPSHLINPQSPTAISWFTRLVKYMTKKPEAEELSYTSQEIYTYFLSVAEEIASQQLHLGDGATLQRGGSCSMQAIHLALRFLFAEKRDQKGPDTKRKRVLFSLRFYSLLDALQTFSHRGLFEKDPALRSQFRKSIQGLSLDALKLYPTLLSDQEMLGCYALVELGNETLSSLEGSLALQTRALVTPSHWSTAFPMSYKFPKDQYGHRSDWYSNERCPRVSTTLDFSKKITPDALYETLVESLRFSESGARIFECAYQLFGSLPFPKRKNDRFWDSVPQEKITGCIKMLSQLVNLGRPSLHDTGKAFDVKALLIIYSGYAMIHKLCMRLPDLQIEGWRMLNYFKHIEKNPNFFFENARELLWYQKLKYYFSKISAEKGELFAYLKDKHVCFGFKTCVKNLEKYGLSHCRARNMVIEQLVGIITYIRPFLSETNREKSTADRYLHTWKGGLQSEFYILQDMAGLANLDDTPWYGDRLTLKITDDEGDLQPRLIWADCNGKEGNPRRKDIKRFCTNPEIKWRNLASQRLEDFSEDIGSKDENQIASSILEKKKAQTFRKKRDYKEHPLNEIWHSKFVYREICRLHQEGNASIAIPAGLHFIRTNPHLLDLSPIQMELKKLFLSEKNLSYIINANAFLIKQLRTTLDKAVNQYINKATSFKSTLFWLKLSYEIEAMLLAFTDDREDEILARIALVQKKVEHLLDTVTEKGTLQFIYLLKIYTHNHLKQMDDEQLVELLNAKISFCLNSQRHEEDYFFREYLELQADRVMRRWAGRLKSIRENKPKLFAKGLQTLGRYFELSSDGIVEWEGTFPLCYYKDVSIDIYVFSIYYKGSRLDQTPVLDEDTIKAISRFSDHPSNPKILYSTYSWGETKPIGVFYKDHRFDIVHSNPVVVHSKWCIDGKEQRYENLASDFSMLDLPTSLFRDRQAWVSLDADERHLLVVDHANKPLLKIERNVGGESLSVIKLHSDSPEKLCSVTK